MESIAIPRINIKIQQFSLNNELIKEWNSITEIKKNYNLGLVQACCNGNRKIAYNFIWKSLNIMNDVRLIYDYSLHYES